MIETLKSSTPARRLAKTGLLSVLAVCAVPLVATFLHADSDGSRLPQNSLVGSWLKENVPGGLTPLLTTYNSDGSLTSTRCIVVPTGPTSVELVSTGHGTWIRTGHNEFAS